MKVKAYRKYFVLVDNFEILHDVAVLQGVVEVGELRGLPPLLAGTITARICAKKALLIMMSTKY